MSFDIRALFEPRSVVLLGASELAGEASLFAESFRLLAINISKFQKGKVYIVDLSGKLEGSEKNLNKVPRDRDLAVVTLPKELLTKNLPKLLSKRVRALILASGELEQKQLNELSNMVKRKKLILLGPNAMMGVVNTANGLLAAPERAPIPNRGHTAVISQDNCVAAAMLDRVRFSLAGISKLVCTGNEIGIDEADILAYLAHDKETKVICVYVRSVRDGRRLVEVIRETTKDKPVVVLKGGPNQGGVFGAAFKQAGALQARNIDEMLGSAEGLVKQPPMRGDRVAVITNFDGQATLAERYLREEGLTMVGPSDDAVERITKKYPSVKIERFINLGPAAKADPYKFTAEQLLSDKGVDGIMVINVIRSSLFGPEDLRKLSDVAKKSKDKPIIDVVMCGEDYTIAREILTNTGLPVYSQVEEAARVLKMLSLRGKVLEKFKQK